MAGWRKSLGEVFIYNFINAMGSLEQVEANIQTEMEYQSKNELRPETHDIIHQLPRADECVAHARQNLVKRLDRAEEVTLRGVVESLEAVVYPQIHRNPLAGECFISLDLEDADSRRSRQTSFLLTNADLAMDVLFDRGFSCVRKGHGLKTKLQVRWDAPRLRR